MKTKNWYYKHKEGTMEKILYMKEGVGTMDAIHLGKLMLIKGKDVSCVQDIKNEYNYISKWCVDEILFPKVWEEETAGMENDLEQANVNRINGSKGGKAKAAKYYHPDEID